MVWTGHILRCDKANHEDTVYSARDWLREAAVVGWSRPKSATDVVHGQVIHATSAAGHLEPKKATAVRSDVGRGGYHGFQGNDVMDAFGRFPIGLRAHVLRKLPLAPYGYRLRKSTPEDIAAGLLRTAFQG